VEAEDNMVAIVCRIDHHHCNESTSISLHVGSVLHMSISLVALAFG
jgi:hypothetical protein